MAHAITAIARPEAWLCLLVRQRAECTVDV